MEKEIRTITVKELNDYVKSILENDQIIKNIWIRGEISNLKHAMSGHYYFTLKDDEGSISVALFKTYANSLNIKLKEGQEVLIKGKVSIYQKTGSYQLYAQVIEEMGMGNIYLQIEQLKQKLQKEGIFNNEFKKPLPKKIDRIGVVTSSKGAVIHDIQKVVNKRNPFVELVIYPVTVQGDTAPEEIIRGIEVLNRYGEIDVIIVGRGGGSLEDLMAFNNENVLRTIFASKIPVISAVGHETDTTLSDYVADIRGATPSHAAEIATISINDNFIWLRNRLSNDYKRILRMLNEYYLNLDLKMEKFKSFSEKKDLLKDKLITNIKMVEKNFFRLIDLNKRMLMHRAEKLNLLSPLAILTKGYSIVYDKNKNIIKKASDINIGDEIDIRMINSEIKCQVKGKGNFDGK
ncbi:MAG: exodeoxyribonuclease VII large subunit [Firmicutes bacterium]|nr:exodeoxyribonuclease VII large subunit [Bacillota bacterium]